MIPITIHTHTLKMLVARCFLWCQLSGMYAFARTSAGADESYTGRSVDGKFTRIYMCVYVCVCVSGGGGSGVNAG